MNAGLGLASGVPWPVSVRACRLSARASSLLLWGLIMVGCVLPARWAWAAGAGTELGATLPAHAALVDQVHLLSDAQRHELIAHLSEVEAHRGMRMGVVLIPSTGDDGIEAYANQLGNAWHIGDAGGVLLIVAVKDKQARIEVSRSVEGRLPDVLAGRILRESMTPAFKAQHYHEGLLEGVRRIDLSMQAQAAEPSVSAAQVNSHTPMDAHLAGWVGVALILFWLGLLVYGLVLFVRDRLTRPLCMRVAGVVALFEAVVLSTAMSVPAALLVAISSGLAVWLILLLASGVRRLFGGRSHRPMEVRPAKKKPSKAIRRRTNAQQAGLMATDRRRQEEDSRSFWQSSSSSSDSSSASSSSDSSSSNDFGGGGASSSW